MNEQHEDFVHFVTCIYRLNSAWRTLVAVKAAGDHQLVGPAFRFALVGYATPYNDSVGPLKSHRLRKSYLPSGLLPLHKRLLAARNQIHAHADLTPQEAKLYLNEARGNRFATNSTNPVHGLDELENIDEIICLIEGTLEKMDADYKRRERAL